MVKSVLGKLIQREFGKERYACYADKLKRKQSMDVQKLLKQKYWQE